MAELSTTWVKSRPLELPTGMLRICSMLTVRPTEVVLATGWARTTIARLNSPEPLDSIKRMVDAYGEKMLRGDTEVGFAVRHFVKDLELAAQSMEALDMRPHGLKGALDAYRSIADAGHRNDGIQSLIRLYDNIDPNSQKA